MLNRAALIPKAKEPFVRWINEADPYDKRPAVSMAEVNEDRTVYLIDNLEAENLEEWIELTFEQGPAVIQKMVFRRMPYRTHRCRHWADHR